MVLRAVEEEGAFANIALNRVWKSTVRESWTGLLPLNLLTAPCVP